ncbi:hydrogenase expression/formation protein [Azospirillum halopraeferens]|uniref:hydrogenase expression/formation protein n=1 Tax=Azospirillum halopraeferens TaxID=34010 RepID=UPI0003F5A61B|nr:hydrogenase expression/formation protein [Azospirillum halopraeferens]
MTAINATFRPPVGFGPGTQPEAGEEGLAYLPMPSGMRTYEPHVPTLADAAAVALLERIRDALTAWRPGEETRVPLDGVAADVLAPLDEALGEGEVSVLVDTAGARLEIQEAALAGVWRVRAVDGAAPPRHAVLIGAFPRVAVNRAFTPAPAAPATAPAAGLMNALPILAELTDRSAARRPGAPAHAVNFSLLPHTPEDLAFLEARLGRGATTILSRGYGNCRVTATATPHVWWVRYYNSVDTLILDTVEVTDVPAVVCAAPEDIADSAERLTDILAALAAEARP